MKKIYKEYFELKSQIAELEEKLNEKKADLMASLEKEKGNKLETPYATFKMQSRITYKYSDSLVEMDKSIKNMRKLEIEKGVAKVVSENKFVVMSKAKADSEDHEVVEKESKSLA